MEKIRRFDELHNSESRMFLGSMDDSVTRYPWDGVTTNLRAFNATLIFYAILGPKLCCRIGNVLYNDVYFDALINEDKSVFFHLVKSGFFQFHMRSNSINGSIEKRRIITTTSTLNFIKKYDWSRGSRIYNLLDNLNSQIEIDKGKIKYNKNFSTVFRKLAIGMAQGSNSSFDDVRAAWTAKFSGETLTRSNFEMISEDIFENNYSKRQRAMSVVNSLNHYAYGITMAKNHKKDNQESFIETKEIGYYKKYTKIGFSNDIKLIDSNRIIEMERIGILDVISRHLLLPRKLFETKEGFTKLSELLDNQNEVSVDFWRHKILFLNAIDSISVSSNIERSKKELVEICKGYASVIRSHVGYDSSDTISVRMRFSYETLKSGANRVINKAANDQADGMISEFTKAALDVSGYNYLKFGLLLVAEIGVEKTLKLCVRKVDELEVDLLREEATKIDKIKRAVDCLSVCKIDDSALAQI